MKHPLLFLFVFTLHSCGSAPDLPGFNKEAWESDPGGCEGIRTHQVVSADLENSLIGLSENEILELLGQPDENELYKRNQKFYIYRLGSCSGSEESAYFQIRFSATNIAREAMVYEP